MVMIKAIILDASSYGKQLRQEVMQALSDRKVKIVLGKGSKLHEELSGTKQNPNIEKSGHRFREFNRNGFFHFVCGKSVNKKHQELCRCNQLKSDDPHVVALAIVSGANVLVAIDDKLIDDFKSCAKIERKSNCLPMSRSVIERKAIKPTTPNRSVTNLLRNAKVRFNRCECMINGGGC